MRVCNKDRSPARVPSCDTAPTPTGFAEIVSDGFPVLHTATDSGPAALLIVENDLRGSFAEFKLCTHFLQSRRKGFNLLLLLRNLGLKLFL
jgi:hypothetical protein